MIHGCRGNANFFFLGERRTEAKFVPSAAVRRGESKPECRERSRGGHPFMDFDQPKKRMTMPSRWLSFGRHRRYRGLGGVIGFGAVQRAGEGPPKVCERKCLKSCLRAPPQKRVLLFPNRPPPLRADFASRNGPYGFGIDLTFGLLDAVVKGLRGVAVEDGDGFLRDDGAGVDALIHVVDCDAGDFDAVIEGLLPCLQTRKSREQRGVDVHDALGKGAQKFAFQNAHEPRQHNQFNAGVTQSLDIRRLGGVIELGAEFSGREVMRGQSAFAGAFQNSGVGDIRNHDDDFRRDFAFGAGVGDGGGVAPFAGAKDAQFQFLRRAHLWQVSPDGSGNKLEHPKSFA